MPALILGPDQIIFIEISGSGAKTELGLYINRKVLYLAARFPDNLKPYFTI